MAFQKEKELNNGVTGDYWRILQRNSNFDRNDDVVTLQLYISQSGREEGHTPLNESIQFNFRPSDHPLSEFDPELVDTTAVEDFRDLELHVRYLHISNIAVIAEGKFEEERSDNEKKAVFFVDAVSA